MAQLSVAIDTHDKMAAILENAGKTSLALSARNDAYARRLAKDYLDFNPKHGIIAALDYGDARMKAGV